MRAELTESFIKSTKDILTNDLDNDEILNQLSLLIYENKDEFKDSAEMNLFLRTVIGAMVSDPARKSELLEEIVLPEDETLDDAGVYYDPSVGC